MIYFAHTKQNAYIWVYPLNEQVAVQGKENMTYYRFATKSSAKSFCKTCGVPLTNGAADLTEEEVENLPDMMKALWPRIKTHCPVNLRVLDGFNLKDIDTKKSDGFTKIPIPYFSP